MKTELFNSYITKISQRIDWLVTTCINSMTAPIAREQAREHLNSTIKEIITEVYDLAFSLGEKKALSEHLERYKVNKYKMEEKLKQEVRKEIIAEVIKEYGIKDLRSKDKLIKKLEKNNETKVEENLGQEEL